MLTKVVSITMFAIASLILLAHDVIPHHHHDDHVCLEHGSCATHHSSDSENKKRPSGEEACCSLADLLIIPVNSRLDEISCSCCVTVHHSGNHNLALLNVAEFDKAMLLLPLPFRQHSQKSTFYLAFTSLSAGLRAPPVV